MPLCPRCRQNERKVAPGRIRSYCVDCERELMREAAAKRYKEQKETVTEYHKQYYSKLENRKRLLARKTAAYYNQDKQPCEECGSTDNVERHHENYDKPTEIKWLCRTCHLKVGG